MAIASCSVSIISRGKGKSSVAAAAYRSGEKLYHKQEKQSYDYSRKRLIAYTEILAPSQAPDWTYNRQQLWNAAEQAETRCNSRTAREIRIALPIELTLEQNIVATRHYAQTFVKQGMIADISIHNVKGNPHAHILLTTRAITPEGFGEKVRAWDKTQMLEEWRKAYEQTINRHLELAGCPERICADSYEKQGIEKIPTVHLGVAAHHMEQRGIQTERGDKNRAIKEQNCQLTDMNLDIGDIEYLLEKERKALALDEKYKQAEQPYKKSERYQKPRPLTPKEIREYQCRAQQRGYHPEPCQLLESKFTNPERRKDKQQQQQGKKKEEEHHERPQRERQREHERGLER